MATRSPEERQSEAKPSAGAGALSTLEGRALTAIRIVGLGLLLWGISTEVPPGASASQLAVWVICGTLVPAWLLWTALPAPTVSLRMGALVWMAAGGGVVAGLAPLGLAFVGTAALGVASAVESSIAVAIAAIGPAVTGIAVAIDGRSPTVVLGAGAAALGGLVLGTGRRRHAEQAAQAALLALERDRANLEHDRAGLLAERNRLAREVHDVLAHTLGALSVQLEALDAQLDGIAEIPSSIREGVKRTRSLATEGLAEARRAVQALRDDASPLVTQLERLTRTTGTSLEVVGEAVPLQPEATLALYRVAQEAITNAMKHAPGSSVRVRVRFDPAAVALSVENDRSDVVPGELASSGAGYGLDGITERLRLVGGDVAAGPSESGWRVDAKLPR